MADDPRVIDILQKLLAKQKSLEGIGTEASLNEASVAAEKVAEIMLRHKIDLEQVEMASAQAKRSKQFDAERYEYDGTETYRAAKRTAWEVQLCSAVARAHNCRILIGTGYFLFLGEQEDRAVAMQMFRILRREVTEACTRGYRDARRRGIPTRGFISSFFFAAINTIQERYALMRQRVEASTGSTALVRRMDQELDDFVKEKSEGRVVRTRQRGSLNHYAIGEGQSFGSRVSLDSNATGPGGRPAKQLGGR